MIVCAPQVIRSIITQNCKEKNNKNGGKNRKTKTKLKKNIIYKQ